MNTKLRPSTLLFLGLLVLASGSAICADENPLLEGYVQIEPGVHEKVGADGAVYRHGEGIEGVDYLLARVEEQVQALVDESDRGARFDEESYRTLVKQRTHLSAIRERLRQNAEKKIPLCCQGVYAVAEVNYQPQGGPTYFIAHSHGGACSGQTYEAMSVSFAVSGNGTKYSDCDYEGGTAVDTTAAEGDGFDYRCIFGRSELYIDAPAGCTDRFLWDEKSDGDFPGDCTWSACG